MFTQIINIQKMNGFVTDRVYREENITPLTPAEGKRFVILVCVFVQRKLQTTALFLGSPEKSLDKYYY